MSAVGLRRMGAEEFITFRQTFIREWAVDIARVEDLSLEQAELQSMKRTDHDLTSGVDTPGQFLFVILDGEEWVGSLWFSVDAEHHACLDELTIVERLRGKGYGSRALELLEIEAENLGVTQIELHVYSHNPVAIALYQKCGYTTTGLNMRKPLRARS